MTGQKQLTRSREGRILGGICAGLGTYFGVDIVLVRLVFLALALVNGLGVMIYIIMWIVVPDEESRGLAGDEAVRANLSDMAQQLRQIGGSMNAPRGATLAGLVMIGLGAMFLIHQLIPGVSLGMLWPILLIALGGYLLFVRK
ncbi:MAG: PspC domain-containing protein [Anaerolineae bacterium]|nr:PspC domain-containing protein [Anaerolineae bacterium]